MRKACLLPGDRFDLNLPFLEGELKRQPWRAFNVEKGNVDRRESNALTGHFVGRRSSRRTRRP